MRRHVRLSERVLAGGGRKVDTHRIHQTQNVHFKIRTRDEEKSKLGRPCERLNVELLIQLKLCRTYYLPPQNEIVLVVVNAINLQLVYCSNTSSVCRFTLSGKLKRVFERPLFSIDVNADQSEHALRRTPWTEIELNEDELRQQNQTTESKAGLWTRPEVRGLRSLK